MSADRWSRSFQVFALVLVKSRVAMKLTTPKARVYVRGSALRGKCWLQPKSMWIRRRKKECKLRILKHEKAFESAFYWIIQSYTHMATTASSVATVKLNEMLAGFEARASFSNTGTRTAVRALPVDLKGVGDVSVQNSLTVVFLHGVPLAFELAYTCTRTISNKSRSWTSPKVTKPRG